MKWMDYAGQVLNLYNYYSGAIMVNRVGRIEYYYNNRPDINTLKEKEVMGKSLFEVYPSVKAETSTLMEVMRTGEGKINSYQELVNFKGERYGALCNTLPIFEDKKIIGAIEVFLYMEERDKYANIYLSGKPIPEDGKRWNLNGIVSVSEEMQELKEKILKVATTRSTVMVYGETGTGKELVVRTIHSNSPRKERRFLSQNCAAIPENLLESILFGTVKGSFTGAENRKGLFEAANGGSLFLDEINSMDMAVQSKILKAIEEQRIMRVGSVEEIPIDVRVMAATNVDPLICIKNGTLREDLYYRLKVVELHIPPLRKRKQDIEPLVTHYVNFFNETMGKQIKGISQEALRRFQEHSWPGNVRELRNMIEGGFNLCEGDILELSDFDWHSLKTMEVQDSSEKYGQSQSGNLSLKEKVQRFERSLIVRTVRESDNLTRASERLGISRQTLNNKIKELKITEGDVNRKG